MVYSASNVLALNKYNNSYKFLINQLIFSIIGFTLLFIIKKINYKLLYKYNNIIFFIIFLLLILVLIPGIGSVRNGSRSWFSIGSFGIQPSEFMKISSLIFVSKYLSKYNNKMDNTKKYLLPILLLIISIFLIILLEPDFGTASIIVGSCVLLIFTSNIKLSFIFKLFFIALIGVSILILFKPYRMARILSFLNPWSDPLGSGFQIIQSMYAIGPNGMFGAGFNNSIQKHFYLPEPQTDFIFAIISEELGIIGIFILFTCYLILLISTIKISLNTKDLFGKYLSFGIISQITLQTLLNLLVVVGLIPVTGVTLPFISYGGSSLLISFISIGIILSINNN